MFTFYGLFGISSVTMATNPPILTYADAVALSFAVGAPTPEETYVVQTGETPLEFLASVYRTPAHDIKDRVVAAKAILEYTHRKVPTKSETTVSMTHAAIDPALFKGLSDDELKQLVEMLARASENAKA